MSEKGRSVKGVVQLFPALSLHYGQNPGGRSQILVEITSLWNPFDIHLKKLMTGIRVNIGFLMFLNLVKGRRRK